MKKKRLNKFFRKERKPFLHTKWFQLKIKADKSISCFFFFFKIKGKVDQKNTFLKGKVDQKNTFFLFYVLIF